MATQSEKEIQMAFLEKCVKEYKIFIDTSSLLQESTDKFFSNIVPVLAREHKAMIMPLSVYYELEKFANSPPYCMQKHPDNPRLNELAKRACANVVRLQKAGYLEVYADPDDGDFADNVFLHVFTKKRLNFNILLITQDKGLAQAAFELGKNNKAVKGVKKIVVEKINDNGFLQQIFENKDKTPKPSTKPPQNSSEEIPVNERFAFAKDIVNIEGNLPVTRIPTKGDSVTAIRDNNRHQVRLIEEIGSGGEGCVYKTDWAGIVAKIYKREKITRLRHEKLKLMLTKDINCEGVCFPLALLYNQYNEFVGYLMKSASGKDLGKSVFMPPLLKRYFPRWTRMDTVQLCVTILKKLKYLHDRNVILGDINPYNILIVSPTEVYFVDTDSWQVEGFICPVGMPLFTAPELQKKSSYGLRTLGNENFAVATLLFMIMHPGKPPYAMQDGEGIVENIIKGDFSYPLGERKTGKVPNGPWRYCWSHLPYRIKEAFYETFRYDGKNHAERKRYGTGWWLRAFENYLDLLKSGKMAAQDKESLEIFPTRFKHQKDKVYKKCKLCGKEYDEESLDQGICRSCLNDGEKYRCASCGCDMIYTNYQKYIKRGKRYDICRNCYEKKNMVYDRRICKNCGRSFEITYGVKEYFEKKGFTLPTHCENCRGKSNVTNQHNHTHSHQTVTTSSGWCFITTAVCDYLGKPDDCFELTTLRNFRDNWLANQIGGSEEIRQYYEIAPAIVEKLNRSEEKDFWYKKIRQEYIEPCLEKILRGDNESCHELYKEMVLTLKQKFSIN